LTRKEEYKEHEVMEDIRGKERQEEDGTHIHERDEVIGESDAHVTIARRCRVFPIHNSQTKDSFPVIKKTDVVREQDTTVWEGRRERGEGK
jgi:hypothetical protein